MKCLIVAMLMHCLACSQSFEAAKSPSSKQQDIASSHAPPALLPATLNTKLIIQEEIYSGFRGVARTQEPVRVGIPLADSAGIKSSSQLGLSGASAGQFRVLGRWPSGNIQWVLVDTLADVRAGENNTSISLTGGSGNFGGPPLAKEEMSAITINTEVAVFEVRKHRFDLIDQATDKDRVLVKPGSAGLVIVGPPPDKTVCPCSTIYSSSNDPASSATIEENGPVHAVVRATGQLVDGEGHAYMRYTLRLHFYKGKARVRAVVLLQNADYGSSGSFASAYKAFRSFEARLTPVLDKGRNFAFGLAHARESGTFRGEENAYLYQAYSDKMEHHQWSSPDTRYRYAPRSYIKRTLASQSQGRRQWSYDQEGYAVVQGDETVARGGRSEYAEGWADLFDATGAGIEVGTYQMAAYWPKSLQFMNGGSEICIGIWPEQSLFGSEGQEYYQSWPQYSMHTFYLNFHDSIRGDAGDEFKRSQYPLIARAPASYYNETKALLYPLVDPEREDGYFRSLGVICCIKDIASPFVYRTYSWPGAGGGNQAEMRWSNLMLWLQRGHVARYVDAEHFYTFQTEQVFPRSDYDGSAPFKWRERSDSELDPNGFPDKIMSLNDNVGCDAEEKKCGRNWIDSQHAHWYGMMDYYFLSGDEAVKDMIEDGASDVYGNPNVRAVKNGSYWAARDVGEALMSDARLAMFYNSTGDPRNADRALLAGTTILSKQVWPELKASGFGTEQQGTSRTRGAQVAIGNAHPEPFAMPFQQGILSEGLWEFLQAEGPAWPKYDFTFDLAEGIARWSLTEGWRTNGTGRGCKVGSGPAYQIFIDHPNPALTPSCIQTVWFNFYNLAKRTGDEQLWADKFSQYIRHLNGNGSFYAEYGSIFEGAVVEEFLDPEPWQQITVPVVAERVDSGDYRLTWQVPTEAQRYRIKYSDKSIVEWLDFDPVTNQFGISPNTSVPWFSALSVSDPPTPSIAGSTQTYLATGLDPKVGWHFAVKAYVNRTGKKAAGEDRTAMPHNGSQPN